MSGKIVLEYYIDLLDYTDKNFGKQSVLRGLGELLNRLRFEIDEMKKLKCG